MVDHASIEDVNRLAKRIKDNWSLCKLFSDRRRGCETEMMVAETIHAARTNAKNYGKPFSFKGEGVERGRQQDGTDNATAYHRLIKDEFFIEGKHDGKTVIYPTKKLIERLDAFFIMQKEGTVRW